jgi:hypothetical protein
MEDIGNNTSRPTQLRKIAPPNAQSQASPHEPRGRYVVVSTQGRGDEAALLAAFAIDVDYVAFVGSWRKAEALKAALAKRGVAAERLAKLKAPAGLDLGERPHVVYSLARPSAGLYIHLTSKQAVRLRKGATASKPPAGPRTSAGKTRRRKDTLMSCPPRWPSERAPSTISVASYLVPRSVLRRLCDQ